MTHEYRASLRWTGSTGLGWDAYDRAHTATAPPAEQVIHLTTGEAHGDPRLLNPEQLVVMAASSCQMLWFLHLAAKARIEVIHYEDEPGGEMPDDWLTRISLRPRIVVAGDVPVEQVTTRVEQAHRHCYVAKSLRSEVVVDARVEILRTSASLVRFALEMNNHVDLGRLRDARDEAIAAIWHPDCVFESVLAGVEGRKYRGFDGLREYGDDLFSTLSDWRTDVEEVEDVGPDSAVSVSTFSGHGHGGMAVSRRVAGAWRVRDRKIVRSTTFATREDALAAARAPD